MTDTEFEPTELDRAILGVLPNEGARIGKYLPDGMQVVRIKAVVDPSYTSGLYSARLKELQKNGFVTSVKMAGKKGHGSGWQRTDKAMKHLGMNEDGNRAAEA